MTINNNERKLIAKATEKVENSLLEVIRSFNENDRFDTLLNMMNEVNMWSGSLIEDDVQEMERLNDLFCDRNFLEALEKINMEKFNLTDDFIIWDIYGIRSANWYDVLEHLDNLDTDIIELYVDQWEHLDNDWLPENLYKIIEEYYTALENNQLENYLKGVN